MNKIKELRFKAGLTLRDLATKSGLSLYSVMAFEHGTYTPYKGTIKALAKALGVAEYDLRALYLEAKQEAEAENDTGK